MSFEQYATYTEIKSQSEAWAQAVDLASVSPLRTFDEALAFLP